MKKTVKELIRYYERKTIDYGKLLICCTGNDREETSLRIKIYEQFIRDLECLEEI